MSSVSFVLADDALCINIITNWVYHWGFYLYTINLSDLIKFIFFGGALKTSSHPFSCFSCNYVTEGVVKSLFIKRVALAQTFKEFS